MKIKTLLAKTATPQAPTARPISIVAARFLLLLLLALPAVVQAQFTYTTDNGQITITLYTGPGGAVTVPSTIDGLPVMHIGDQAFYSKNAITSITIPDTVKSIGNLAFSECDGLASITIPDSVTSIGSWAFAYSGNLANVTLGEGVASIGEETFTGCRLNAITVDPQNSAFSSADGILFNKNQTRLIRYPHRKTGNYTIPNSVITIGNVAFQHCGVNLTGVKIGNAVTDIGAGAFSYTSLTDVTIPDSVISVGDGAFAVCGSLTKVTLGSNVTSIGNGAFVTCLKLTSIAIPDSVTSIGSGAFDYCTSLRSATLGNSITNIGNGAFSRCSSLASVTIPNSVASIGGEAFSDCYNLTRVTFGHSVTSIGNRAFVNCTSLIGAYFQSNAPNQGEFSFGNAAKATVYYRPGTTGWGPTFAGLPTVLWNPQVLTSDAGFGVRENRFEFTINGTGAFVVVVDASAELTSPFWTPVGTNVLTGGSANFIDFEWANYPIRFYRLRMP